MDIPRWEDKTIAKATGFRGDVLYAEHHESHAASAFYPSPFAKSLIITLDGVGEWATSSVALGNGNCIENLAQIDYPHSLGLLYSAFTHYTGFKVNSGEYKVMGLAPYGEGKYTQTILDHVVDVKPDGSFRLNMDYFNFHTGLTMTSEKFHTLFGGPPREPETTMNQRDMDLARSIQEVTETIVERMVAYWVQETGERKLCMAGGVALNCVANGKLLQKNLVDDIWVQPAAGDAGGAVGCALAVWYNYLKNPRVVDRRDSQKGSYLGPQYSTDEVETFLKGVNAPYEIVSNEEIPYRVADILASGLVVGWHQGRMEFGPRALGARSILGDPRLMEMQKTMNLKIKFRESFRPFAPSVLREDVGEFFESEVNSPYMLLVSDVKQNHRKPVTPEENRLFGIDKLMVPRSDIPAITHVDYSARIQSVS